MNRNVITTERVRMFGRRQRQYIIAYLAIEKSMESSGGNHVLEAPGGTNSDEACLILPEDTHLPAMKCQLVERLVKVFKGEHKTHRNIKDQEVAFMKSATRWMRNIANNKQWAKSTHFWIFFCLQIHLLLSPPSFKYWLLFLPPKGKMYQTRRILPESLPDFGQP